MEKNTQVPADSKSKTGPIIIGVVIIVLIIIVLFVVGLSDSKNINLENTLPGDETESGELSDSEREAIINSIEEDDSGDLSDAEREAIINSIEEGDGQELSDEERQAIIESSNN